MVAVDAGKRGVPIAPTMYGLFYEDVNFAADGGMYAELVKNRSFEFAPNALAGWHAMGQAELRTDGPFARNPHYLRLRGMGHGELWTGLQNEGFFGMGFRAQASYRFSLWARVPEGEEVKLRVSLVDPSTKAEHQVVGETTMSIHGREWQRYEVELAAQRTVERGQLRLILAAPDGSGRTTSTCDVEHISLFPTDTWRGHRNGLRHDIVQALYDLRPGVFRFPGGCIVEGTTLNDRYDWKASVGPVENRPTVRNRWMNTFHHRLFPDYFQSYGLGFYELFLLSEDLGAEPLPVMNVGMACQYQNWERPEAHAPATAEGLAPYIQDCLDLIEFANGDTLSHWGRLRAQMGHPEPFRLKYIAVGNEQWGQLYFERLRLFVERIRAAYPHIRIVGSSGPNPDGRDFDEGWVAMTHLGVDLVDEHFYRPIDWYLRNMRRYDGYSRTGPRVFAGEYACHDQGKKYNHAGASLYEAAFMTGLERNADIVEMATYAPMLAHVDGWQWRPDMVWFDNLRTARTASYYVQQLFSTHRGTHMLPLAQQPLAEEGRDGVFSSAVWDEAEQSVIVKVVNTTSQPTPLRIEVKGLKRLSRVHTIELCCAQYEADNTPEQPTAVVPRSGYVDPKGNAVETMLAAKSFVVFKMKKQK